MFSFKEGKKIAKIRGGIYDGETLKINEDNKKNIINNNVDPLKYISEKELRDIIKQYKGRCTTNDIESALDNIRHNRQSDDIYVKAKELNDEKSKYEIQIDGNMYPYPDVNDRDSIYISGPPKAGKSYWISLYLENFKKAFPEMPIYVFSQKYKDPLIDNYLKNPAKSRITIDESLYKDPIDSQKELKNSLCIFDDIDAIIDQKVKNAIYNLMNEILKVGRDSNIYILITTHMLSSYRETREMINNTNKVVLFPNSGSSYYIEQFLKKYCGLKKKSIDRIMNLNSRWIEICRDTPQYILYEHGAMLLTQLKN